MNYEQAQKIYETSRKRKLTNNTYLEKNTDGSYAIRQHSTQIIKFYPEKTVLDSGGWRSVTTKARLNVFTPFDVKQKHGIWYVRKHYTDPDSIVFADGVTYNHRSGKWTGTGPAVKKTAKLRTQAKQYAKDFVAALFAGKVPKPDNGDCFYCVTIVSPPSKDAGRTLGEVTNGDHVISHIREKYYVPSLLVNSTKMFPISRAAEDCIARLWANETPAGFFAAAEKRQIESAIRRYCYRQLQTA